MKVNEFIVSFLHQSNSLQAWPKMLNLVSRAAAANPRDWQLPLLACEAVGGDMAQGLPAAAAIACSQISIILIDDLLDADPRGEHCRIGLPATANLASAFQSASLEALTYRMLDANARARFNAARSLNEMFLTTALGQFLDTQNPNDEAAYWRVVKTKSAPFFGTALHIGALVGGAAPELAVSIKEFGRLYGEMIQLHDDLNDCMASPANPDWTQGRSPLPILYAQNVEHPARQRFFELRQRIPNTEALTEAQNLLIQCGAISYTVHHLLLRYRAARSLLDAMPLLKRADFDRLLDELKDPVMALFQKTGANEEELLSELFAGAEPDWITA